MAGDTERGPGPSLFFYAVGSASRRGEGGLIIADLLLAVGTVSLHLTGLLETQTPKCLTSITNMCKQENLSKRMIRDSARQKAGQKTHQQAAPPPCSICMLRWPFFSLFPSRTEKKSGTVACWRIMAPNPSHPVFLCPPSPVPLHLPSPLGSFLQRKRERKCLSKFHKRSALYPYMYIMHIHIRHVAGGCNTALQTGLGCRKGKKS